MRVTALAPTKTMFLPYCNESNAKKCGKLADFKLLMVIPINRWSTHSGIKALCP